jgi:CDP-diacylglycerol--serine O-phosphatidyltransferase
MPTGTLILRLLPFLLTIAAGFRLAKFNIDERQTHQFIGLPTPANGLMVLALPLVLSGQPTSFLNTWLANDLFIPVYSVTISYLMISPLRLYSIKIKGLGFQRNKFAFLFIAITLILLIVFRQTGLFLIVPAYVVFGAIMALAKKE